MNETDLLNATLNATGNLTDNGTVKEAAAQVGSFNFDLARSVDMLLNNPLSDGVAQVLNTSLNTHLFSGQLLIALMVVGTVYLKWNSVVQFVGQLGGYVLLTAAAYLILKSMGVF